MKPGKKSAAALEIVPPPPADQRAAPLPALTKNEAQLWSDIVRSLPADWFRPSDMPILAAYCQAAAQNDKVIEALKTAELMLQSKGRFYKNPLLSIQHQSALRMTALAVRLRLCPSTRYGARGAEGKTKNAAPAGKPWQFGNEKAS